MDHAEAFAVAGIGVVEAAAEIRGKSVLERVAPRQNRSSRRQPERLRRFDSESGISSFIRSLSVSESVCSLST